ncbi:hypothetical protein ARAM_002046 [Aspergillus rambellii]|uniref:tryptophan synthase n=1 Tax=Aspergillus rambellii TaxID=308745 RepID=A0A0F8V207_9EURO|nr:hypothetical protein ARAM_002046 [Aspergillus rambellii]
MDILLSLPSIFHHTLTVDDSFWTDFADCPLARPSPLHLARNLTQLAGGGANIWLKREDLNAFASAQTRTIVGQVLFAQRLHKSEIIMECGFAGHALVCATMCARLNLQCTIVMGAADLAAQPDAVAKVKQLGAQVLTAGTGVAAGGGTLRAAMNSALQYSLSRLDSAYHILSGTRGPDALVSAVGSGAAALGMFAPFIDDPAVRLVGVEPADAAPLTHGSLGVMYGCRTLMLQDEDGQILPSRSIAPDLNFPCAGPELAHWKDIDRLETVTASSEEAVRGLRLLCEQEGIVPGLATGHAVLETIRLARELGPGRNVVLLVSG